MLVFGDRFVLEWLTVEIMAQYEGAIVHNFAPGEAKEGVLGLEVTDLQDAIDLGRKAGTAAGKRQFRFSQRQVFQPLDFIEIWQTVQSFLLGVRQDGEQLILVAHRQPFPRHASPLAPRFRSRWCA